MGYEETSIRCELKNRRQKLGWSQGKLAEKVGIKRQAVYDIEAGRYLPNTGIAIRLAKCLGCRVEDLFVEREAAPPRPVTLVCDTLSGSRILAARVRNRMVSFPLTGNEMLESGFAPADGILERDERHARFFGSDERLDRSIVLLGCDPAFTILGAHLSRATGEHRLLYRFASSHQALDELSNGHAHLAGTHFHNLGDGQSNVIVAKSILPQMPSVVVGFSQIEEGLMVQRKNPMNIRQVSDLAQPEIRVVNREPGAALRSLLDDHLDRMGIPVASVQGYDIEVKSHVEGAQSVLFGRADAALGLRAIAEAFGLCFVPLVEVRCDLVIPVDFLELPAVRALLDVLQSKTLRRELDSIAGYGSTVTGTEVARF